MVKEKSYNKIAIKKNKKKSEGLGKTISNSIYDLYHNKYVSFHFS